MTPLATDQPVIAPTAADTNAPLGPDTIARLKNVPILASLTEDRLHCLDGSLTLHLNPGDALVRQGEIVRAFCILLSGSLRFAQVDSSGHELTVYTMEEGTSFGEVPLVASIPSTVTISAATPAELLKLNEDQFWSLMTSCPEVRRQVLANLAHRLQKNQVMSFQQEKLAALGTMAAGLMHELNNPGSAARRAASQLRENLMRMHRLSPKFVRTPLTEEQKECVVELQECAFSAKPPTSMSSIEQSDAEEALASWMEDQHVEDAWKLAPSLVAMGINSEELQCARSSFSDELFSMSLNWLEAMVSSMQLVGTIEESIGRVTELVSAVKSYAYEGRGLKQTIDVNKSLYSTLVVLGHKIREKALVLEKSFAPDLPQLVTECQGLNQIWTNILDNAIDASPQNARLAIRTWKDDRDIVISIADHGSGIPLESQEHIFDPFYTTKPVGVGTGLGLGIVHKIVEQYGGTIRFSSVPGETEFVVRLPTSKS
jgi:signal transduction histidine kinase